jgi:hypothetical protein
MLPRPSWAQSVLGNKILGVISHTGSIVSYIWLPTSGCSLCSVQWMWHAWKYSLFNFVQTFVGRTLRAEIGTSMPMRAPHSALSAVFSPSSPLPLHSPFRLRVALGKAPFARKYWWTWMTAFQLRVCRCRYSMEAEALPWQTPYRLL